MPNAGQLDAAQMFEPHRRHLRGLAYRMLGSIAEAEDVVQDAYLRWHAVDRAAVIDLRAFLTRIVTRLCLDQLKSARKHREVYVGPWLPEPVVDEAALTIEVENDYADDLSVALLLTLERLSPGERASFLLHDVFELSFAEVARVLERSEPACRQLASRARSLVRSGRPRYRPSADECTRLTAAFSAAVTNGDLAALTGLLATDAEFHSDGGGKVAAARQPIVGAEKIAGFLLGLVRNKLLPASTRVQLARINSLPGFVLYAPHGAFQTLALEMHDGLIARLYTVRNPDKLKHVVPGTPPAQ